MNDCTDAQVTMIVRRERSGDFPNIYSLVKSAFESAPHAEGDEQDFVARQRNSDGYVPELALVVEDDGQLIGHIIMTRTFVSTAVGRQPILLLACVAVVAGRRRQGVGRMLIEQALQKARDLGHSLVIVVGDPDFYSRLGFKTSAESGITNKNGIEPEYVQIREIVAGALREVSGCIELPV